MNYHATGWTSGNKVYENSDSGIIEGFLIQCDEDNRL